MLIRNRSQITIPLEDAASWALIVDGFMETRYWIPVIFTILALVYGYLALLGFVRKEAVSAPAQTAWIRIAFVLPLSA